MTKTIAINNEFYDELGERWYRAEDDPVALLRAEARTRNPWVAAEIAKRVGPCRVLDIACGAGFLANELAQQGHRVTGVDLSSASLEIARRHDATHAVDYRVADALALPFGAGEFDAVAAMDFLEHTAAPARAIAEAARVLRPGGLFFFHTFNRNPISWLIVIKGVEWFVRNTPTQMHVYPLFLKPREITKYSAAAGLEVESFIGLRPRLWSRAFWRMLATGKVAQNFEFVHTRSLTTGYSGIAIKRT